MNPLQKIQTNKKVLLFGPTDHLLYTTSAMDTIDQLHKVPDHSGIVLIANQD
jgi:hypothetical protein